MFKKLEAYIGEIDHYLSVREGKKEILEEIKSHILEKAEAESGKIDNQSIEKIISEYGKPYSVAMKYIEDTQIISPIFKKHLFRYTGILFVVHSVLILIALLFSGEIYIFPFFYIPDLGFIQALNYIPMALIYDFGFVGLVLYFVTQKKKDVRLPWPRLKPFKPKPGVQVFPKPKVFLLALMLLGFAVVVYVFVKYKTLFFYSLDNDFPRSLLNPEASFWYSMALIVMFAVGIGSYILRFFYYSYWIDLVKYTFYLTILLVVLNNTIKNSMIDFPYYDLKTMAVVIIGFISALYAYLFLKNLVLFIRQSIQTKLFPKK